MSTQWACQDSTRSLDFALLALIPERHAIDLHRIGSDQHERDDAGIRARVLESIMHAGRDLLARTQRSAEFEDSPADALANLCRRLFAYSGRNTLVERVSQLNG